MIVHSVSFCPRWTRSVHRWPMYLYNLRTSFSKERNTEARRKPTHKMDNRELAASHLDTDSQDILESRMKAVGPFFIVECCPLSRSSTTADRTIRGDFERIDRLDRTGPDQTKNERFIHRADRNGPDRTRPDKILMRTPSTQPCDWMQTQPRPNARCVCLSMCLENKDGKSTLLGLCLSSARIALL
ncbi:hypothetical protein DM02DRAFT_40411 [Periconia macrospinosa]|uniref:Uncharacterized protein n=1 Tax=Periconia macrospinosa TaxID=97972 RepID=A0A2V1DKN5_9PLEO|nr:hypothetical protein DM02DRAFT_40411 [Periconia macrospinosa]